MDIQRQTKKLFRKYQTNCPFTIAKMLNIHVVYLDLPMSVKGYCQHVLRRKFIVLNQNLEEETERRFVCAHELGHMILHQGFSHYFLTRNTYFVSSKYEREAHQFAIHLLLANCEMQGDETIQTLFKRCGIPEKMETYFDLSTEQ